MIEPDATSPQCDPPRRPASKNLPDRPAISQPARTRETGPTAADHHRRWARQPRLGLAGLLLVVPIAVLLAVAVGGAEPSLLVLGPIVTFALPVVAMIAFWWNDWPGTVLRSSWSGWVDTAIIAIIAIGLTVLGQAAVGQADLPAVFDPTPSAGQTATFPETLPIAGAAFVVMLQLTLVCEGWPLRQYLGRIAAGLSALGISWFVAILLYAALLGGRPFTGAGPDVGRAVLIGGQLGALLTLIGAWQVWVFVVWNGWPIAEVSRRSSRIAIGNAVVLLGAGLSYVMTYGWLGLITGTISALAGSFVAAGLVVGMLFEGSLRRRLPAASERVVALVLVLLLAAALYVLLLAYASGLQWSKASAEDWVNHVSLNAIGTAIILHVAIGRRWPFGENP